MMFSRVHRLIAGRPDLGATLPAAAASAGSRANQPGSPVQLAHRQAYARPLRAALAIYAAELAILVSIGAGFGWMAPFGTLAWFGTLDRFAFWMLAMPLVGIPASLAMNATMRNPSLSAWPWPARIVLGALIAAVPGVLIVRALAQLFGGALGGTFGTLASGYLSVALLIAVIGLLVTAATGRHRYAAPPLQQSSDPVTAAARPSPGSPFLARIPPRLGKTLRRIETEDHYLRVHTDVGNDLILFRLADALAELDPSLGQQVHRSHWVARASVAAVERDGPRTTLVLVDDARVPVSRTFLPALRKAGWL